MTYADKIRAMSDEELADFLFDIAVCATCIVDTSNSELCDSQQCYTKHLNWLQSEAE